MSTSKFEYLILSKKFNIIYHIHIFKIQIASILFSIKYSFYDIQIIFRIRFVANKAMKFAI